MIKAMQAQKVPMTTLHGLLRYAYEDLWEGDTGDVPAFENLDNLFAEFLMHGIEKQLKRGLYKTYVRYEEPLTMIRGKVDVHQSIKLKTQLSRQLYCAFDEFEQDNFYNQVLKATCLYLLRRGKLVPSRSKRLRDLLFHFVEIHELPLSTVVWETIPFHKDKFAYRTLIGICYFIYKGIEEDFETETTYLSTYTMQQIYTRFLHHFFKRHYPQFRIGYQGKATNQVIEEIGDDLAIDMTLTSGDVVCLLNSHYDLSLLEESKLLSPKAAIQAQVRKTFFSVQKERSYHHKKVYGFLLYPSLEAHYLEDYTIAEENFYIGAMDLRLPFKDACEMLFKVGESLENFRKTAATF